MKKTHTAGFALAILVCAMAYLSFHYVLALPGGATITPVDNESNNGSAAGTRQDPGGVVVTMNLNARQQNANWKAYVGNVTGTLTLDDAEANTVYNWNPTITTGEVYVTRNSSVNFASVVCANSTASMLNENAYYDFGQSDNDSINSTFNWTTHPSFLMGTTTVNENDCISLYTYKADASQEDAITSDFSEILLADNNDVFIYVSILENKAAGFDSNPYDFQTIVPENGTNPVPKTYYFYVEIG